MAFLLHPMNTFHADAPIVLSWFIHVCMFLESLAECYLGFTNVCVAAVNVPCDVINGSTLVFFWCSVFRVYYHRAEGVCRLVVCICICIYCVTYKFGQAVLSGQAVLIILPRMVVPT